MSTEFTVGLEGGRNSSKVLKPPGGGSSDIFGMSSSVANASKPRGSTDGNTQSRLFGKVEEPAIANVPVVPVPPTVTKKSAQPRRNPITGEGFEEENAGESIAQEKGTVDTLVSEKANEQPIVETPRVIQTSIRIRNPPGGKSSGIF